MSAPPPFGQKEFVLCGFDADARQKLCRHIVDNGGVVVDTITEKVRHLAIGISIRSGRAHHKSRRSRTW